MSDLIDRQVAIDVLYVAYLPPRTVSALQSLIADLPPAQPERDIPIKPNETIDRSWGIPKKEAVCPKCDYYLGNVAFLGEYKGKRVTYCETCGQAIDWEEWDFDGGLKKNEKGQDDLTI